jgi:hypothetical protein
MRVTLILLVGALALPAFAGGTPQEITLPDTPAEVIAPAARTGRADDVTPDVADATVDGPVLKDPSSEADEPDGPPCGEGG